MHIKHSFKSITRIIHAMTPTNVSMGLRYIVRGNFKTFITGIKRIAKQQNEQNNRNILTIEILELSTLLGTLVGDNRKRITLVFDHMMGGGANSYRKALISERVSNGELVVLVTYQIWDDSYHLTYSNKQRSVSFTITSLQDLAWITKYIDINEIFYNNLVSYPKTLDAVEIVLKIKKEKNCQVTVAIHDFYSICPSYTLLNREGKYCDIPNIEECIRCLPHNGYAFPRSMDSYDIITWRNKWQPLIESANSILCFSDNTRDIVKRVYDINPTKIHVQPHNLITKFPVKPKFDLRNELCIGVIGIISYQKGANLVIDMAKLLKEKYPRAKIVVIGTLETTNKIQNLTITGPYNPNELPKIIESNNVNICFFPSIWPETFSYVCSEIIEMQMPLCCFNIGAPVERVKKYKLGNIISTIDSRIAIEEIIQFYDILKNNTRRF
jgi:O-antigen biosynthesis protein